MVNLHITRGEVAENTWKFCPKNLQISHGSAGGKVEQELTCAVRDESIDWIWHPTKNLTKIECPP